MSLASTYVDGRWRAEGLPVEVRNPADVSEVVEEVLLGSASDVDEAEVERAAATLRFFAAAAARVIEGIGEARAAGAVVAAGGGRGEAEGLERGHFVEPTILAGVAPDARIAQEEVFGPVLAVLAADSDEEAVAFANGTPYGLSAAVLTRDLERALGLIDRLEAGMVHVNAVSSVQAHVPFGGFKDSGFGPREQGKSAADFFTELQVVDVQPRP